MELSAELVHARIEKAHSIQESSQAKVKLEQAM